MVDCAHHYLQWPLSTSSSPPPHEYIITPPALQKKAKSKEAGAAEKYIFLIVVHLITAKALGMKTFKITTITIVNFISIPYLPQEPLHTSFVSALGTKGAAN